MNRAPLVEPRRPRRLWAMLVSLVVVGVAGTLTSPALAGPAHHDPAPARDQRQPTVSAGTAPSALAAVGRSGPVTRTAGGARLFDCRVAGDGQCGRLRVPLDRADPSLGSVRLFFLYYRHRKPGPSGEAIMLSEGGPGYSVVNSQGEAGFYRQVFDPLLEHRDLIMLDQRGVGRSGAIDCPDLQEDPDFGSQAILHRVARCGRQLGATSSLYGSGDVALDMEAVRKSLGIESLDLYGGSYAGQDVQSYAVRFPRHVRAAVLDSPIVASAFGAPGSHFDDFLTDVSDALPVVADLSCARSTSCSAERSDAHDDLAWLAQRLGTQPVSGTADDAAGTPHAVTVTESSLAWTILQADDFGHTALTEVAAAAQSLRAGDQVPLLRLAAEAEGAAEAGAPDPAEIFSEGDNLARACTDLTFPWDKSARVGTRMEQWEAARDELPADRFGAFSKDAWLQRPPSAFAPDPCIEWPTAEHRVAPAIPPGATYPASVPALVITGDLDLNVPAPDSEALVDQWAGSDYVEVQNAGHHTIFATDCSTGIIVHFIRALEPGDTSCAQSNPQRYSFPAIGRFPVVAADAVPAVPAGPDDRSGALDREVATVATSAVTDALRREFGAEGGAPGGVGLRGGTFTEQFNPDTIAADLQLSGVRFASDVAVSGSASYGFSSQSIDATVEVDGPGEEDGQLHVTGVWYGFRVPTTVLEIRGTIGGRDVTLEVPAS